MLGERLRIMEERLDRLLTVLVDEELLSEPQADYIWEGKEVPSRSAASGRSRSRSRARIGLPARPQAVTSKAASRSASFLPTPKLKCRGDAAEGTRKTHPCQNAERGGDAFEGCEKVAMWACQRLSNSNVRPRYPFFCNTCYEWYSEGQGQCSLDLEKTEPC